LGLFCYENFFFDKGKVEKFEKEFNLRFKNIVRLNIKENLIINLKNKRTSQNIIHIPFKKLTKYMRSACAICGDFTNIYSDISFGGLGSPDKFTTVIARTKKGENVINKVIKAGVIKTLKLDASNQKEMKEKISLFSKSKIVRMEKNMRNKLITWKSSSETSRKI